MPDGGILAALQYILIIHNIRPELLAMASKIRYYPLSVFFTFSLDPPTSGILTTLYFFEHTEATSASGTASWCPLFLITSSQRHLCDLHSQFFCSLFSCPPQKGVLISIPHHCLIFTLIYCFCHSTYLICHSMVYSFIHLFSVSCSICFTFVSSLHRRRPNT